MAIAGWLLIVAIAQHSAVPQVLPHNLEAERAVLGALLIDNDTLGTVSGILEARDFFRDAHGKAFDAIARLFARGAAADLVTLTEELEQNGQIENVGGPAYLASLTDGVPKSTNVEHYARIVRKHAQSRGIIAATTRIRHQAYASDEPSDVLADAIGELQVMRQGVACERPPLLSLTEVLSAPAAQPIVSPFLFEQSLAIMAGHPGAGKSTVACDLGMSIATGSAWHGHDVASAGAVLFIDAEGSLRARAGAWCRARDVHPDSVPVFAVPQAVPLHDRASVRALVSGLRATSFRPVLVVVDTLARCSAGVDENGSEGFGRVVDSCSLLIRELGATVLLIHHFRKSGQGGGDDGELRGHSSLRGAADTILYVTGNPSDGLTIRADKQRHVPIDGALRLRARPAPEGGIVLERSDLAFQSISGVSDVGAALLATLDGFGERGATFGEWQSTSGVNKSSFNRGRAILLQRGLVREHTRGRYVVVNRG